MIRLLKLLFLLSVLAGLVYLIFMGIKTPVIKQETVTETIKTDS
jgi:hypothetical protein